jgi:photosystem II stability/assembly factor-like uncharacterized protein
MAAAASSAPCTFQSAAVAGPQIWLLCEQQELLVSTDGGTTWQAKRLPSQAKFRDVAMIDSRRGVVVGEGGTLLATEDGGETWRQVSLPTQENLTSVHFVGDLGWLAGWSGVILHSRDGGRTWQRQQSGVLQGLECIYFRDADHGWAVGWVGAILRTRDGGRNWERVRTARTLWSLNSVYFTDLLHGWAVGFGGLILSSDDGGATWQERESPAQAWFKSVAFDAQGRGWIAADNRLLVSEDGGRSWRSVSLDSTLFLQQVLPAGDSVWAVGQFGVLKQAGREPRFTALAIERSADRAGDRLEN